ncbi:glycosyltransferase family 4 protein [Sediminibacterium soli]|uniref:glycosyltransferase family 4 protein n=1 Tax=Sediminibacterium soli TaxID=2698829 RepID=UPI00137A6EB1|nr:glycosyltransferase family 4 protein [Sediminibacterium soli]NCI48075.1 glycosyltransferase family 4 protein [Sediminibacterium soli]
MRVLFIAPLPPPINGQSIAANLLLEHIKNSTDVDVVNMTKSTHQDGLTSFRRVLEVISFFKKINKYNKIADVIYLHISESIFGNIKDLVIYFLCRNKLNKFYIHLHGGTFGKQILCNNFFLEKINAFFLRRLNGVIVLGPSHTKYFERYLDNSKIHIIPNFYLPEFLIQEEQVFRKFNFPKKIKFLFLSNMIDKKGYMHLLNAFLILNERLKERIQIDFAGHFNSATDENIFRNKIEGIGNIKYHGVVSGEGKAKLLANAHVFVLPTSYNEGQPISILEAYASGCAVLVTMLGGIPDIFKPDINGYALANDTPKEIARLLKCCIEDVDKIKIMALTNYSTAKKSFSTESHIRTLLNVLIKING